MSPPPSRIQIAQRIRQDLLREIDHEIEIARLLDDVRYARDVLLVCDALLGCDLPALASMFREATQVQPNAATAPTRPGPGRATLANEWGRDTSGFGVTQPPSLVPEHPAERAAQAERRHAWLERWRRN